MEARRGSSFIQHFDKLAFDWLTAGVAKSHEICEFCLRVYFHIAVEKKISLDLCRCPGGKKAEELSLNALGWTCGEGLASSLAWKKHLDFWGKRIPRLEFACLFLIHPGLVGDLFFIQGRRGSVEGNGAEGTYPENFLPLRTLLNAVGNTETWPMTVSQ